MRVVVVRDFTEGEQAAEIAGIRPRRSDDEDGRVGQPEGDLAARQKIVPAIEAHPAHSAAAAELRSEILHELRHVPVLARTIEPTVHSCPFRKPARAVLLPERNLARRIQPELQPLARRKFRVRPRLCSLRCRENRAQAENQKDRVPDNGRAGILPVT